MIRRPPRSTQSRSSAASDVYKRQPESLRLLAERSGVSKAGGWIDYSALDIALRDDLDLSLIHISEPTRLLSISYAVFCLKKKKNTEQIK